MKKFTKIICAFIFTLGFVNLNATTFIEAPCDDLIMDLIEEWEYDDGCYDAETYNELYNELREVFC